LGKGQGQGQEQGQEKETGQPLTLPSLVKRVPPAGGGCFDPPQRFSLFFLSLALHTYEQIIASNQPIQRGKSYRIKGKEQNGRE
jgi:hypothetical protein